MTIFHHLKELSVLISKKSQISIQTSNLIHISSKFHKNCEAFLQSQFQYKSLITLILSCCKIQLSLLGLTFFFTLLSSFISIYSVKLNDYVVQYSANNKDSDNQISQILKILLYIFLFKTLKNLTDQFASYLTMNCSFRIYSSLYYNFLTIKSHLTGQVLNIIDDDLQKLQYFVYYLVNILIMPILIITLSIMLIVSLNSQMQKIFVGILLVLLIVLYFILARVIFYVNQRFMKKKDKRLQMCIDRELIRKMFQERKLQVLQIRKFLWVETLIKWSTQLTFVLLYVVIFIINFEQNKNEDRYYQLMLLGMIKTPMQTICFIFYNFSSMINSLKRICLCVSSEKKQSQHQQNLQQSLLSSSLNCLNDTNLQQQQQAYKIEPSQALLRNKIITQQDQQIKNNISNFKQKGQIKFKKMFKYINQNTNLFRKISLVLLSLLFFLVKFQRVQITNKTIFSDMTVLDWIIFISPLIIPFMLILSLINFFFMISLKLFQSFKSFQSTEANSSNQDGQLKTENDSSKIKKINIKSNNRELNGQELNRISGDIQAVDKGISLHLYDFVSISFTILGSLLYSILNIKQIGYQLIISVIIIITILGAGKSNRYFMKSRRQVKRQECRSKSKIIQLLKQNQSIQNNPQMKQNWIKVYICKNIGIMIQNSYIFVLYVYVLIIQLIFIAICLQNNIFNLSENETQKIMITIVLQLDYDLFSLFISSINMEIGLVSFQRCINMNQFKRQSVTQ